MEDWLDTLAGMVEGLAHAKSGSKRVSAGDRELSLSDVSRFLGAGLTERRDGHLRGTVDVEAWAKKKDPLELVMLLHARVRFMGELLVQLVDRPLTHESLREVANEKYRMGWASLDQVRRRSNWLRATGMATLFDGLLRLTPSGAEVLNALELGEPSLEQIGTAPEVPSAGLKTLAALNALESGGFSSRADGGSLYLPSPETGSLSVAHHVVQLAEAPVDELSIDEALVSYGVSSASARQARGSLHVLGLISRVSESAWAATPEALEWASSGEGVDFVRIAHARVRFVGEILGLLREGALTTAELASRSGVAGRNALSTSAVRARLGLLREAGMVTKLSQKEFHLTPLGRAAAGILPLDLASSSSPSGEVEPRPVAAVTSSAKQHADLLVAELLASATDSRDPNRMEYATRDAFRFLGFQAERIGGAGRTDVTATRVILGKALALAIDAKSSGEDVVPESQVSFQALAEHRAAEGASTSLVVGNDFHRRTHTAADQEAAVGILLLRTLVTAVTEHASRGLDWNEIESLVDPTLTAVERHQVLERAGDERKRRSAVMHAVLRQLMEEAADVQPMRAGAWLGVADLRRDLRHLGVTVEEVHSVLSLMASESLDIVQRDKELYRLALEGDLAARRIPALSASLEV
ncbi:hypothetical protein EDF27_2335 [Curtobacterium sp. PhB136]|nr:hypothetical protein EDF27_2335 [Curtobacterium sp. PhB136]